MKPATFARIAALAVLAGCGGDTDPEEKPTPALQVTGRVIDDEGAPMSGLTVSAFIVGFPSTAMAVPGVAAPSCDEAIVPEGQQASGEDRTAANGTFTVNVLELNSAQCLIVKLTPAGAPEGHDVALAPRLVSPAQIPPASVPLGDLVVGMLD